MVASLARHSAEHRLLHPIASHPVASPLRSKGFRFSRRGSKPMLTTLRLVRESQMKPPVAARARARGSMENMNMTASASGNRMITGLFSDGQSAERAYQVCVDRGYDIGEVNVVMSDDTRQRLFSDGSETTTLLARRKAEGGELGGPTGGRVEILVTIFAAVGVALALPVLGFVVAGPIAAALAGAGAAGLAAGLIGALGDWGIPEERVRVYEAGIHDGGILMMVEARSDEDARQIEQEWKAIGGRELSCC